MMPPKNQAEIHLIVQYSFIMLEKGCNLAIQRCECIPFFLWLMKIKISFLGFNYDKYVLIVDYWTEKGEREGQDYDIK